MKLNIIARDTYLKKSCKRTVREKEIKKNFKEKEKYLKKKTDKFNTYLEKHKRSKVDIKLRDIKKIIEKIKIVGYNAVIDNRKVILVKNNDLIEEHLRLTGGVIA